MIADVSLKNQRPKYPTPGRCYDTKHTKKQAKDKKRAEYLKSKDWKMRAILYIIYCIHRSTESVYISQTTLGKCINVNRDTCRNSYLRPLVKDGWMIEWIFRFYQTCIYRLPKGNRQQIAYLFRGVKRPVGFKLPPWLFGMVMGTMTASQAYFLLKYDLTHESFLRKGIRSKKYIENGAKLQKKLLKCKFGSPDPNVTQVFMTKYNLNKQKAEFLARNEIRVISLAMEDVDTYVENFGKTVSNYFGFLLNRCKHHGSELYRKKKLQQQKESPKNLESWLMAYFKAHSKKIIFIAKQSDLDLATSEPRPFVQFLKHKEDFKKSVLKVWQKVRGQWIDKVFVFDRQNLADSIEFHLEKCLKQVNIFKTN